MTMCVFWKDGSNNIHMASDSRLNNGTSKLDHCLKISTLSCDLYEPISSNQNKSHLKGSIKLAVSFCGGFVSAYTIKESLAEILNKMVFAPDTSIVSMDLITNVALKVYEKITRAINAYRMNGDDICAFYIAGFCPLSKKMEMYKLECKVDQVKEEVNFVKEKCFQNEPYVIVGSGAQHLRKTDTLSNHVKNAFSKNKETPYLDLLSSVITDESCDSVGGSIQYAKCDNNDVIIYGMYENNNGDIRYMRAGVDINELINDVAPLNVAFEFNMIEKI